MFGGVWIDTETGRVKYGLVQDGDAAEARAAIAAAGLEDGADVVPVRHSQLDLIAIVDWLNERLAPTRKETSAVMYGIATDENVVDVQVPRTGKGYELQRPIVEEALAKFGDAIKTSLYDGTPEKKQCSQAPVPKGGDRAYPFCHPPLRGGITLDPNPLGNNPRCTGAFITTDPPSGWKFQMTAGHCLPNYAWYVPPFDKPGTKFVYNGARHQIGPVFGYYDGWVGDAGIITVGDPVGWGPQPFIFYTQSGELTRMEEYKVKWAAATVVGTWVCAARAASGSSDCGYVTQKNFTDDLGTQFLDRASYCLRNGDSGSPISAWSYAFGVARGSNTNPDYQSPCNSWHTTIEAALWLTNTKLVVWPY